MYSSFFIILFIGKVTASSKGNSRSYRWRFLGYNQYFRQIATQGQRSAGIILRSAVYRMSHSCPTGHCQCYYCSINIISGSQYLNGTRTAGSYVQACPVNKSAMSSLEFVVSGQSGVTAAVGLLVLT